MTDLQSDNFNSNEEKLLRLLALMKKRGIKNPSELAKEIKTSQGYISEILNRKKVIPKTFGQKLEDNLNINRKWFETGVGDMFNAQSSIRNEAVYIGELNIPDEDNESPYIDLGNGQFLMVVPLIPIRASAGYREHYGDESWVNEHYEKHYFPVSRQYRGKYFAFVTDGDSMDNGTSEAIVEGSTVTGREIQRVHWRNKFHLNSFKDYVIVHRDAILVKRIIDHDVDNGTITCHSLNPDKTRHPDFVLNLDECLQICNIVNVTQTR